MYSKATKLQKKKIYVELLLPWHIIVVYIEISILETRMP